jgi:hypothetical protein
MSYCGKDTGKKQDRCDDFPDSGNHGDVIRERFSS